MHLTLAFVASAVVATAAQDFSVTLAPTSRLLERQIAFSSVGYTTCTTSGGLAVACSLAPSSATTSTANEAPEPTQQESSTSTPRKTTTTPATDFPTSASASGPSSAFTWTSVQTDPESYNMALTTVFTPPPECTSSFTQVGSYYWQDVINPAPQKTLTSCYPSQFYSSVVGAANSVALPAFDPLVCPFGWSTIPYNSTYGACCPDGWGAFAPSLSNAQRPLSGAICTSLIISGMFFDVTSYDSAGSTTVYPTKAGTQGGFLLATGFDGMAETAATTASSPTAIVAPALTATTGPAPTTAGVSSVAAKTLPVTYEMLAIMLAMTISSMFGCGRAALL